MFLLLLFPGFYMVSQGCVFVLLGNGLMVKLVAIMGYCDQVRVTFEFDS
jgi:hypothetical protein